MKFLRSRYMLFLLLAILVIEIMFRVGLYEPLVSPYSHSGTTITLKRKVETFGKEKVNVVTFGDSRAAQGMDNQVIYKSARKHGLYHMKLAMPGSHFLTFKALAAWSLDELTGLKGVVFAISPGNFGGLGNGTYELAKVLPLRNETSVLEMFRHVPLNRSDIRTYTPLFSVAGYRDDIKDLLTNPGERLQAVRRRNERSAYNFLTYTGGETTDICAISTADPAKCLDELRQPNRDIPKKAQTGLETLCKAAMRKEVKAEPGQAAHELVEEWVFFLEELSLKVRVMVVILPGHSLYQQHLYAPNAMFVINEIVSQLQNKGVVDVVDLHELIVKQDEPECGFYLDALHMNVSGKQVLTQALLPSLNLFWNDL
jgi:hypothetical protein